MKIEQNYLLEAFVKVFNCEFITKDKLDEELAIFKSQLNSWKAQYNELKRNNNSEISEFQPTNIYDYLIGKIGKDQLGGFYLNHFNKYDLIDKYLPGNSDCETEVGVLVNATIEKYKLDAVNGNPEVGIWKHKPLIDFIESKIISVTSQIQNELIINPPLCKIILKNLKKFKEYYNRNNMNEGLSNELELQLKSWANFEGIADLFHQVYYYLSQNEIDPKDILIMNFGFSPYLFNTRNPLNYGYSVISIGGGLLFKNSLGNKINILFSVFIIGGGLIKNIEIGTSGLLATGGTHIIKRDIKKINIVENNVLQVYYHGEHLPSNIVMDSYKDALNLQDTLIRIKAGK